MNFFTRLLGRKQSEAYALMATTQQGHPQMTPLEFDKLASEGYNKNAIAFRCVNMIANAITTIDFELYKSGSNDDRGAKLTEIESHPILDLLMNPRPGQPGEEYFFAIAAYLQLSGNAYIHAVGPSKQEGQWRGQGPKELWVLNPQTVKVIPGIAALPGAYRIEAGGSKLDLVVDPTGKPSQVLQIKTFNPLDPWYGMSPIEAAAFSIDQHNESGKWNVGLLQNSARPSGAFIAKAQLRPEQREFMKRELEEKFAGAKNAGKPMVLEGDFDFKAFSFSPKDMEWIESKHTSARDICNAFGVPSQLIGIPGDSTYANYREARQAFWIETVLPLADRIVGFHNIWLPALFGAKGVKLGYGKDALDALSPSRDALWDRISKANHISTNEKRVATGFDERPEPEYEEVLVSSTMLPLSMVQETQQTSIDAASLAAENGQDPNDPNAEDPNADPTDDAPGSGGKKPPGKKPPAPKKETDGSLEFKIFNARNASERARTWKAAQRKRHGHERRFAVQLKAAFSHEAHRVSEAVQGMEHSPEHAIIVAKAAIDESRDFFMKIIESNLMLTGKDFGHSTIDSAKSSGLLKMERKDSNVRFDSYLSSWVKVHAGRRVTQIAETTKRKIAEAINEGFENEEGIPDIAERVAAVYKGFSDSRATLIARTETASAANAATLGAAKSTGIPNLQKEWISSNDERSRDGDPESTNHIEMDATKIAVDDKFEVWSADGTDLMDAPGDQSAPVDQIANCRCTLGFSQQAGE
jgi:HK97 family phage portal protein